MPWIVKGLLILAKTRKGRELLFAVGLTAIEVAQSDRARKLYAKARTSVDDHGIKQRVTRSARRVAQAIAPIAPRSHKAEIERDTLLIPDDPGVVSGRDQVDISGGGFDLGAILHPEAHPPEDEITEVPLRAELTFARALLVL